jgi:anti-anti-sigma factor
MFEIIDDGDNVIICKFSGKFDTAACDEHMESITPLMARPEQLCFDFEGLEFIASSFFRICLTAHREKKEELIIINVPPVIRRMFKISNLDQLLLSNA